MKREIKIISKNKIEYNTNGRRRKVLLTNNEMAQLNDILSYSDEAERERLIDSFCYKL